MKKIMLAVFMLLVNVLTIHSQEVAPFELKEKKAVKLGEEQLALLTGKTWAAYRQYQIKEKQATLNVGKFTAFRFSGDGKWNATINGQNFNGTWTLENKRRLKLLVNNETEMPIAGTYAVLKLSDNEMVFVKSPESGDALRMLYYCRGSKTSVLEESPLNMTVSQQDAKTREDARKKREREALLQEISTEAQLRGIKVKKKLETMDVKLLQVVKNQILAGTYGKKKTKS